jgi:hypothetical protein
MPEQLAQRSRCTSALTWCKVTSEKRDNPSVATTNSAISAAVGTDTERPLQPGMKMVATPATNRAANELRML